MIDILFEWLINYRYIAIFVLVYCSVVILPLPSNILITIIGVLSSQGYFGLFITFILTLLASISADTTGYLLTYKYGYKFLVKIHFNKKMYIAKIRNKLRKYSSITIFATRIVGPFAPAVNFLSGLTKIKFLKFLPFDLLGNIIHTSMYLLIGYLGGQYWRDIIQKTSTSSSVMFWTFLIGFIIYLLFRNKKIPIKKD